MKKEFQIKTFAVVLNAGLVNKFEDVFNQVPMSTMAQKLGMNYIALKKRATQPQLLSVAHILKIADILAVSPNDIFKLILAQLESDKNTSHKKK